VDRPDQRRRPGRGHDLQPVHLRPPPGWHQVDRKVLADIAVTDPRTFASLVTSAREGLNGSNKA
jgi:hypothetical protein